MADEGTPPESSWRDGIEPDVAKTLEKFVEEDKVNLGKMGRSYLDMEREFGGRLKIPDDDDSEGWNKVHAKLGRPEKAEGYEFAAPEGMEISDEFLSMMRNAFFEGGGSQKLWKNVTGRYLNYISELQKNENEAAEQANAKRWERFKWDEATRKENVELAKRVVLDLGDEEITEYLTPEKIEKDPLLVLALSHALRMNLNDTLVKGEPPTDDGYKPANVNSPEMYAHGEDEESRKARAWFRARGHKYDRDD